MNFIVDTTDTYYLDKIYGDIDRLINKYSSILSKQVIGKSVEGMDIFALKLSAHGGFISPDLHDLSNLSDHIPSVLFTGGIHAREDFSVMLIMKMIDYYSAYYNEGLLFDDYDVKKIIKNVNMYFIPTANPDGLNIVHHGLEYSSNYNKLKEMKIWGEDHTYWKANANGVDLNKNFDDGNWDIRTCVPGTDVPCSDRFKGFEGNSEPETKALIDFCNSHDFSLMVAYHCSGNCVFWADSGTHSMFKKLDDKIIDEFSQKYIYRKTKISEDPKVYGCGFENWFRNVKKRPGFCIELSPFVEGGKQHPDNMFDELVWQHAKSTGLFFAEKAAEINKEIYSDIKKYAALTK